MASSVVVRRVLIAIFVLVVLLVIADRVAATVASRAVARQVRTELELAQSPSVQIRGFPFLTQAIRGRYGDVRVRIPGVDSGPLHNVDVDARLQDVRAPLSDLIGGRLERVPVTRITGTVAVDYDDLAQASGVPGLKITPTGDSLVVTGQVQVLGQRFDAVATGRVRVVDGDLVITASEAKINGVDAPRAAVDAAARVLSFRVSPKQLPLALRITGVTVGTETLSVAAEANDVVLERGLANVIP